MQTMEYEMEMIPVDTEKQQIIYEDHSLSVETVPLKHRLPCCGYIFRETYAASYQEGYDRLLWHPHQSDQQHQEWG